MNLDDRLDRLASRQRSGSPTFVGQFLDADADDMSADLAASSMGKVAILSLRDIDAETPIVPRSKTETKKTC